MRKSLPLFILFLGMCLFPNSASALGLAPPTIEVESILRNTTQQRSVVLLRSPDDVGDFVLHVKPEGPNANFILGGESDIIFEKEDARKVYEFDLNPGDAPNGKYQVNLSFLKSIPKNTPSTQSSGFGVAIITGVTAQVFLTVGGEEYLNYELLNVSAEKTEVGKKLNVAYSLNNTGNIDWQIEKIQLEFKKKSDMSTVNSIEIPASGLTHAKAGQPNQHFSLSVEHGLPEGEYFLAATFFEKEKVAGTLQSQQSFTVFPAGTLAQKGSLKALTVNKSTYQSIEKVKLNAVFANEGDIGLDASLVTNIYRNNALLDLKKSDTYHLDPGEETTLSEIFTPDSDGSYKIEGYVEFGNKKTDMKTVEFEVGSSGSTASDKIGIKLNSFTGLGILSLIILACIFTYVMLKRRHKIEILKPVEQSPPSSDMTILPTPPPSSPPSESSSESSSASQSPDPQSTENLK